MQQRINNFNKEIEINNDQVHKYNQQMQFIQQYNSGFPTYIPHPSPPVLQQMPQIPQMQHMQHMQQMPQQEPYQQPYQQFTHYYQQQPPHYRILYSPTDAMGPITTLETDNTE